MNIKESNHVNGEFEKQGPNNLPISADNLKNKITNPIIKAENFKDKNQILNIKIK